MNQATFDSISREFKNVRLQYKLKVYFKNMQPSRHTKSLLTVSHIACIGKNDKPRSLYS